MPTSPTTITALPTAPNRSTDTAANFNTKADAMMAALVLMVPQINSNNTTTYNNAVEAAASATAAAASATAASSASTYFATTTASLSLATGTTGAMTIQTGKAFAVNDVVVMVRQSDRTKRMYGTVSAASSGSLTVNRTAVQGSGGPYTDWMVFHQALESIPPATAADLFAGTATYLCITPAALRGAQAFSTLTYAATVAWDIATQGFNAEVTLAGNGIIGAISNLQDGDFVALHLIQDGTGSRLPSWNTQWDFGIAGTPTLSTGAGKRDQVYGQYRSSTGKIHASMRRGA